MNEISNTTHTHANSVEHRYTDVCVAYLLLPREFDFLPSFRSGSTSMHVSTTGKRGGEVLGQCTR